MLSQVSRKVVIGVAGVGLVAASGAFVFQGNVLRATEVTVTGTDYAFVGLPQSVPAGQVSFIFRNSGKVRHEMAITRVKQGVSAEDAINGIKNGGRRRDFIDGAAVLAIASPGEESSRMRLVLEVRKGETYLVSCTLKDKPDSPTHLMLGMYTAFRVD